MSLDFYSEEELLGHFIKAESEQGGIFAPFNNERVTHYYKLKNPPPGAELYRISILANISTEYYTEREDSGEREHIWFEYYPLLDWGYDTEESNNWPDPRFPEESYKRELDGLTYYISKGEGSYDDFRWRVEWYNADGYHMSSNFPYRFTADEVLAYVSDLERVEIG